MNTARFSMQSGFKAVACAGVIIAASLGAGCSSTSGATEQGAGYGALGGAAIGGALGGWSGAAIGAGAGALGGAAVGAAKDNADANRYERSGYYDRGYDRTSGRDYYDPDRDQWFYYDRDGYRVYYNR